MGIYGALSSAVTGLRAQAHALENISGNIANSQTTGYKRIETDFLDLIPDAPISRQVPGAVLAQSRGTNNVQGDIKTVSDETFIALNSNGFFVVEPKIGQSDGNAVFAGTNFYTRRGDFEIDKDGLLVNGAGYYLKGLPIDTLTGNISGSVPEVIELSNNFLPAQATTRVNYQANLPQLPKNTGYNATEPGSELLDNVDYAVAATATGMTASATAAMDSLVDPGQTVTLDAGTGAVVFEFYDSGLGAFTPTTPGNIGIDIKTAAPAVTVEAALGQMQAAFRANGGANAATATIGMAAGSIQISLGSNKLATLTVSSTPASVLGLPAVTNSPSPILARQPTISAANDALFKSNSVAGGAITVYAENGAPANVQMRWAKVDSAASGAGHADTWNLFYMSNSTATGNETMWTRVPQDYVFGADGALNPEIASTTIAGLSVNGAVIGDVELHHGSNGISQFADVNGTVNVSTLNQNGYGAGEFVSVAINDSGRVVATYSNGERIDMAQVVTAEFNAINKLKRLDGGVFSSTSESGEAILDLSGSGVIGGALEASNTDISDEFTKLIVTQQAYAAGTRIVSTADEMLQEALNMIR